jgi:hypothetical protein
MAAKVRPTCPFVISQTSAATYALFLPVGQFAWLNEPNSREIKVSRHRPERLTLHDRPVPFWW